jgi:hypothetical protein
LLHPDPAKFGCGGASGGGSTEDGTENPVSSSGSSGKGVPKPALRFSASRM